MVPSGFIPTLALPVKGEGIRETAGTMPVDRHKGS
jgi:hypothetical protein